MQPPRETPLFAPEVADFAVWQGMRAARSGEFATARAYFRLVLGDQPGHRGAAQGLVLCAGPGDPGTAREGCRGAAEG